jgi:hypothetical protein
MSRRRHTLGAVEALLAWIYPNRIPIAIATIAIAVVVAVVGWRRGWHHAARRHARLSAIGVVAALVIGLPLAWYLGSPVFIRTALVEPAPVIEPDGAPSSEPSGKVAMPSSTPARPSAAAISSPSPSPRSLQGSFAGADDFHFAEGTAGLVEVSPGRLSLRVENFSVRNGPDLYVYLSPDPDGYAKDAIELGRLKATDGSFNYDVPADVEIEDVRSVVIWCKAFSVQFGAARLSD